MSNKIALGRIMIMRCLFPLFTLLVGLLSNAIHAEWFDPASPYRRSIDPTGDLQRYDPHDTIITSFYTAGHHQPGGTDVYIATEDGRVIHSRVINIGPGDLLTVVFNPLQNVKRYYAYFGNPEKNPKNILEPATITAGLLMEVKRPGSGGNGSIKQLSDFYNKSGNVIGAALLRNAFQGFNPITDEASINKITGTLYVANDGDYSIAVSSDDCGGLRIDGQDAVFAPGFPEDIRFNKTIKLTRGPHKIEYYHLDTGGDCRFVIAWKRPDSPRYEAIPPDSFGKYFTAPAGKLEKLKSPVTADMNITIMGECFANDNTSYRVNFEAIKPENTVLLRYEWDFGDGQTANAQSLDHVYLKGGVYDVKLKIKNATGEDTQIFKVCARRDPTRMIDPPFDEPPTISKIIGNYNPATLTVSHLPSAVLILARAKNTEALPAMIARLCSEKNHPNQQQAVDALEEAINLLIDRNKANELVKALDNLTPDSNLQPKAGLLHASVLLWQQPDFPAAIKMLAPLSEKDSRNMKRLLATALILDGKVPEAKKMFATIETDNSKRVALSGALARSIEYFINQGELDAADEKWEEWQRKFPDAFLEGYAVLLKVQILKRNNPMSAVKIAESFAKAVPDCTYSPSLLDLASQICKKTDPKKSAELRQLLKERYPEDPLSQDK